jgi:hypothetical protein
MRASPSRSSPQQPGAGQQAGPILAGSIKEIAVLESSRLFFSVLKEIISC